MTEDRQTHIYLFAISIVLVLCQAWMLNQASKLSELLKAGLQSRLAEFPKWQLVFIVADLLQHCIEMVFTVPGQLP